MKLTVNLASLARFVAPHTNEPPTEALVFGLAGGIGAGVFAFLYEAEDVATFFIGGRHLWQDDVAWFEGAARRLHLEAWATKFAPGRRMFSGLRWAHEFIEHADTGGGLCRSLYAEFLAEVGAALDSERLLRASEAYAALGSDWSRLADALLPDDVPVLAEAKRAVEARTELVSSGAAPEAIRDAWHVLDVLAERAATELREASARMAQLRDELSARVQELHIQERQALVLLEGAP